MTSELDKINKIKSAVRRNFDASPVQYDAFEGRYGFFKRLNADLLQLLSPQGKGTILDIGCGTGASSAQLKEACPQARIVGLDNSSAMLAKARLNYGSVEGLCFQEGDATALTACLAEPVDTVIYSASIFLIPDFRESLRQAHQLLSPSGQIGLTFLDGVVSETGENRFFQVEQAHPLGLSLRKAVLLSDLEAFLRSLFGAVSLQERVYRLPKPQVQAFYSIPAMSAGIFPALDYEERLVRIATLFDHLPEEELLFRWVMIVGTKS
jgi:ubiquinone/menaquinone biosynthesis C-methylase UbiE